MALTSTLVDDFNTQDAAKWTYAGTAAVAGGSLVFTAPQTGAEITSVATYSMVNSYVAMKVTEYDNGGDFGTQVGLIAEQSGNQVVLTVNKNGPVAAWADQTLGASQVPLAGWVWGTHPYVRIREASSVIYWEYSADGRTWTTGYSEAKYASLDLTVLSVRIYGYQPGGGASGTWKIADVNVVPPYLSILAKKSFRAGSGVSVSGDAN